MNLQMMVLQIPYAMIKLIAAVVVYIKIQNEINNAASSFSKYGECSSIHIVERRVCIVMHVNCMCITNFNRNAVNL